MNRGERPLASEKPVSGFIFMVVVISLSTSLLVESLFLLLCFCKSGFRSFFRFVFSILSCRSGYVTSTTIILLLLFVLFVSTFHCTNKFVIAIVIAVVVLLSLIESEQRSNSLNSI